MRSSPNSGFNRVAGKWGAGAVAAIAVSYPAAVYWLHSRIPFAVFAIGVILLLVLRSFMAKDDITQRLRLPLLCAAFIIAILAVIDPAVAAKAYPALLSLLIAVLFANSLRHAPSVIERIARLRDPALTPEGSAYCRRVTWIWTLWLTANATIAAVLAMADDLRAWALWTGLISYLCSAALFVGERLLRPLLLRRIEG